MLPIPCPPADTTEAASPWSTIPFSQAAFERGVLANANLAGDSANRGALVGCLLGLTLGAHNIPRHLIDGLVRKDEVLPSIRRLAAAVCRQHALDAEAPASSTGVASTAPHTACPFPTMGIPAVSMTKCACHHEHPDVDVAVADGLPSVAVAASAAAAAAGESAAAAASTRVHCLPRLRVDGSTDGGSGEALAIAPPVDDADKLRALAVDAERAGVPVHQLRYERKHGPLVIPAAVACVGCTEMPAVAAASTDGAHGRTARAVLSTMTALGVTNTSTAVCVGPRGAGVGVGIASTSPLDAKVSAAASDLTWASAVGEHVVAAIKRHTEAAAVHAAHAGGGLDAGDAASDRAAAEAGIAAGNNGVSQAPAPAKDAGGLPCGSDATASDAPSSDTVEPGRAVPLTVLPAAALDVEHPANVLLVAGGYASGSTAATAPVLLAGAGLFYYACPQDISVRTRL